MGQQAGKKSSDILESRNYDLKYKHWSARSYSCGHESEKKSVKEQNQGKVSLKMFEYAELLRKISQSKGELAP